jgi:hypothetical protein
MAVQNDRVAPEGVPLALMSTGAVRPDRIRPVEDLKEPIQPLPSNHQFHRTRLRRYREPASPPLAGQGAGSDEGHLFSGDLPELGQFPL